MAAGTAAAWRRQRQPGGGGSSVAAAARRAAGRQRCVGSRIASARVGGGGSTVTLWGGGLRQLNAGFYGIGCPHPAVECLAAQLNKLIMHYGSKSCLGLNLQTSLELMIIEMGTTLQPLAEDYNQCHHWVTPSWLKLIWEKAKSFDITVNFAPLPLEPPREQDSWIMKTFIQMNYNHQELCQLNRV
jgi:hypothetical protein